MRDCAQRGHHWHEADGRVFARKKSRDGEANVAVHCCHCSATHVYPDFYAVTDTQGDTSKCGPNR